MTALESRAFAASPTRLSLSSKLTSADRNFPFAPPDAVARAIAGRLQEFFRYDVAKGRLPVHLLPSQSRSRQCRECCTQGASRRFRDKLILRPQEISNHPELIRRLGCIAMNGLIGGRYLRQRQLHPHHGIAYPEWNWRLWRFCPQRETVGHYTTDCPNTVSECLARESFLRFPAGKPERKEFRQAAGSPSPAFLRTAL
jgi:hypothetical protein